MLNSNINAAVAAVNPVSNLRLRPRVQDIHNGSFQPVVVYDDGGQGGVIFGDTRATLEEAYGAACDAIEAAIPGGEWDDEGEWYASAA